MPNNAEQVPVTAMSAENTNRDGHFKGTNEQLCNCIEALLDLNEKGAVSHRVPGMAVSLLEAARHRLTEQSEQPRPSQEVVRKATCEILGYSAWQEATDYRLNGEMNRQRDRVFEIIYRALSTPEHPATPARGDVVGYVCPDHLQRRAEFERHGSTIYDRPLGTYTTPVFFTPEPRGDVVEHMTQRFLSWRLPEHFRPDAGISFEREFNVEYMAKQGKPPMRHEPTGTNLFDYTQAKAMIEYLIEGIALTQPDTTTKGQSDE